MKTFVLSFAMLTSIATMAQPITTPDQMYGNLFHEVQMQRIFPDGKTFVDCTPKRPVKDIMYDYGLQKGPKMNLKKFVEDNFNLPVTPQLNYVTQEKDVVMHIKNLWAVLKREPNTVNSSGGKAGASSLLPLPHPYIVPGGRFREIYYWDSYFTMLGLKESGEVQTIENMIDNFAYLIQTYGHIPNGNRSYYVSRSQPPFFALMVELLAGIKGKAVYKKYLPALLKEYQYWMRGSDSVTMGNGKYAVVKLGKDEILNRYWDDNATPRQESYREDMLTADTFAMNKMMTMRFASQQAADKMRRQLRSNAFRHLRAGAASGWDFSSRWFADGEHIHSIETTNIIPVDLNSLLYQLEIVIARAYKVSGVQAQNTAFLKKANKRALLINKYCWNKTLGYYADYHFANQEQLERIAAAGMFPFALLPMQVLEGKMAIAKTVLQNHLLKDGGVLTTPVSSHQQWDAPNGWAPLQWMSIWALDRNNEKALAKDVAQRWCKLNVAVFMRTGKLMEKYNVVDTHLDAGGGEYPSQDGFGWTNGVLLALMKKYEIKQ